MLKFGAIVTWCQNGSGVLRSCYSLYSPLCSDGEFNTRLSIFISILGALMTWSIACSAYQFMRSICVWVLSLTTYRLCSDSRNGNHLFIKSVWSSGRAHCHMSLKAFLYLAYLHCCCWEGSSVPAMRPVLHLDNMEISGQDYTASLSSPISYVWQQPVTL